MKKLLLLATFFIFVSINVDAQKTKPAAKKTTEQSDDADDSGDDEKPAKKTTKAAPVKKAAADADDADDSDDDADAKPTKKTTSKSTAAKSKAKDADDEGDDDDEPVTKKSKAAGGLNRVEIEAKFNSDHINLIPVGDEGVLVFFESDERSKGGKKNWEFVKYNTQFKEAAKGEYEVDKDVEFIKAFYDPSKKYVYVLLSNTTKTSLATGSIKETELVRYDVRRNKITSISSTIPIATTITDMYVAKNTVYFGGFSNPKKSELCARGCLLMATCGISWLITDGNKSIKFHPILFYGDFSKKEIGLVPIEATAYKGFISNISKGTDSSNVAVSISNQQEKGDAFKQEVKIMGQGGNEGKTLVVNAKPGIGLNAVTVSALEDKSILALGSYVKYKSKDEKGNAKKYMAHGHITDDDHNSGFYISKLVKGKQQYLRCYPFSNFVKREESKKAPTSEKGGFFTMTATGSEEILFHDPIESEQGVILVAEFYCEHYHIEYSYTSRGTTAYPVFDGYVFTNALVACFDSENGDMLWNNVFDINFYTPPYGLGPKTTIMENEDNNKIVMVYNDGTSLKSKVLNKGKMSNGTFTAKLNTGKETDKVVGESASSVEHWFDNYFIAYGYERIKTKGKLFGGRRQVFYFNKIEYR